MLASLLCNISCAVPLWWRVGWRLSPFWLKANFATFFTTRPPSYSCADYSFTHYTLPCCVFARVSFFGPREEVAAPRMPSQSEAVHASAGQSTAPAPLLCSPFLVVTALHHTSRDLALAALTRSMCIPVAGVVLAASFPQAGCMQAHSCAATWPIGFAALAAAFVWPLGGLHSLTSVIMRFALQPRACVSIAGLHSLPSA